MPPSTRKNQNLSKPDNTILKDFGIENNGRIVYQFYEKYGFTDIEEHLILLVETDNFDHLNYDLPLESDLNLSFVKIDLKKFETDEKLNLNLEKELHSDIRIDSKEYDSGVLPDFSFQKGKYHLTRTDTIETIYILDSISGLLYIESKK